MFKAQWVRGGGTCNEAFCPLYASVIGRTIQVSRLILAFVELWSVGGTGGTSSWTADDTRRSDCDPFQTYLVMMFDATLEGFDSTINRRGCDKNAGIWDSREMAVPVSYLIVSLRAQYLCFFG